MENNAAVLYAIRRNPGNREPGTIVEPTTDGVGGISLAYHRTLATSLLSSKQTNIPCKPTTYRSFLLRRFSSLSTVWPATYLEYYHYDRKQVTQLCEMDNTPARGSADPLTRFSESMLHDVDG